MMYCVDLVHSETRPPWNERWMEVDEHCLYERLGNLLSCIVVGAALCRAEGRGYDKRLKRELELKALEAERSAVGV